ncbi:MAG: lytic transglycosylase domain-containing protein [Comamonadaceae bacterium]|nr:MAG: lytic transglycosylase domain-containing protein [Comamonadaceae bacterium]
MAQRSLGRPGSLGLTGSLGHWRTYLLGCLLLILQHSAHADLWAYVDARGVTHFAAEPLDERYALFFRGGEFDSMRDGAAAASAPAPTPSGARLLTYFDIAPGYKSVKHHLRAAAGRYGVDYELLQALIATESGFDAGAVSPRGAVGLMQLMPATATRFGVAAAAGRTVEQRLADPATNVAAGTRYLRHLLDLFEGRMDLALAAYNAGEGAVQRAGQRIPAYRETQNYVKSVLGLYAQLKPPPAQEMARRAAPGRIRMQMPGTPDLESSPSRDAAALPARVALGATTEQQANE